MKYRNESALHKLNVFSNIAELAKIDCDSNGGKIFIHLVFNEEYYNGKKQEQKFLA